MRIFHSAPIFFSAKTRKTITVVNVAVVTAKELG
jgi:hypothetical protein